MMRIFTPNRYFFLIVFVFQTIYSCFAQVGIGTVNPDTSAILDIRSPNKGILLPRTVDLGANRKVDGSLVYDSVNGKIKIYHNAWTSVNPLNPDANDNVTAPGNVTINGTIVNAPNATVTANNFVGDGTIPVGGIIMWSGTTVPSGWALCDGGTANGFTTPNLSGRFIVGYAASNISYNQPGNLSQGAAVKGKTGGADSVKITNANLPVHDHGVMLPTTANGMHYHMVESNGNRGPGGAGREPVDYDSNGTMTKTNYAPDHVHYTLGLTEKTGGVYTSDSIPNPPIYKKNCTVWEYTCITNGYSFQTSMDISSPGMTMITNGSQEALEWAPQVNGYKVYTSDMGESWGYSEISNNMPFPVSSCTHNNNYDPLHPNCKDPLHTDKAPLDYMIHYNEKHSVRAIDNRPSYYVLAFIMRIR
jgi:hypothetical protein